MPIGFKGNITTSEGSTEPSSEDNKAVEDLSQSLNRRKETKEYKIEHDSSKEPAARNKNKIVFVVILAIIFLLISYFLITMQNNSSDIIDTSSEAVSESDTESVSDVSNEVLDISQNDTVDTEGEEATTEDNPNAVYDDNGNLVSDNGIYDTDGNIISSDEDVINPGLPNFEDSNNNTTTAVVYSASDYIKDLNGVDVSAVYNIKSRDYIQDFVNYEAKRAIIDDGMELYWLEVLYGSKKYRVQVPFYAFKDLDKTGICAVEIEVLTLEGGEKIISYMQIITDYSNLSN